MVFVVTSSECGGCFGVYSNEDNAYNAICKAYGSSVERVDRANRKVRMETGEELYLMSRLLDDKPIV